MCLAPGACVVCGQAETGDSHPRGGQQSRCPALGLLSQLRYALTFLIREHNDTLTVSMVVSVSVTLGHGGLLGPHHHPLLPAGHHHLHHQAVRGVSRPFAAVLCLQGGQRHREKGGEE